MFALLGLVGVLSSLMNVGRSSSCTVVVEDEEGERAFGVGSFDSRDGIGYISSIELSSADGTGDCCTLTIFERPSGSGGKIPKKSDTI